MPQTTLSIRIDDDLKKQFDAVCSEFGMNISTAITVFAKTIVRERRIPFEISAGSDPFYGEANMAWLREAHAQYLSNQGFIAKSLDELIASEDEE